MSGDSDQKSGLGSDGATNLGWIMRFHLALLPLGAIAWGLRSLMSLAIFAIGGLVSLLIWHLHMRIVSNMIVPSKKLRWFFGILGVFKLGLIAILLHVTITYFPSEVLPFVTGLLLFVLAILAEAARLAMRHFRLSQRSERGRDQL